MTAGKGFNFTLRVKLLALSFLFSPSLRLAHLVTSDNDLASNSVYSDHTWVILEKQDGRNLGA